MRDGVQKTLDLRLRGDDGTGKSLKGQEDRIVQDAHDQHQLRRFFRTPQSLKSIELARGTVAIGAGVLALLAVAASGCANRNASIQRLDPPVEHSAHTKGAAGSEADASLKSMSNAGSDGESQANAGASGAEPAVSNDLDEFASLLDSYLSGEGGNASSNAMNENASGGLDQLNASATQQPPQIAWRTPVTTNNSESKIEEFPQTPADRLDDAAREVDADSETFKSGEIDTNGSIENAGGLNAQDEQPAIKPKSYTLSELIVMVSAQLHRDAAYSQMPLREHLLSSAFLMWDKDRRIDPAQFYDLNEREREILANFQDFFIQLGELLETTHDPNSVAHAIEKLAQTLEPERILSIPAFRLCTEVRNYGNFAEIEEATFVRGQVHEVIAYVEVEHFDSPQAADGSYKTVLTQEIELYSEADGTLVHQLPGVTAEDRCGNVRRDFFLVRHVAFPSNLNVGSYNLKVRVIDEHSGEQAEAVMPITIVASAN